MDTLCRARRWLIAAAIGVVLFTVMGFLVLPPIIKAQAEKRLAAELGRAVRIGRVQMNPYALSVTVEDFEIQEQGGRGAFLGWRRLYVNVDALASLRGEWVVSDVELDGFHAAVGIKADGAYNFSDVLAKLTPPGGATAAPAPTPGPAKAARPVRVAHLVVSQARVDFSDASRRRPFATTVGPISFGLKEFRTAGANGAPYHFAAVTEAGEKIAWTGTLAADPVASKGEFEVGPIVLKKYLPYVEDRVLADVTDGKLSVRGRYEASFAAGARVLRLKDGQVLVSDLRVVERAGAKPVLELKGLEVAGIQADAVALKAAVGRVALTGGRVTLRREKDGSLNVLALLPPGETPPASAAAPALAVGAAPAGAAKLPEITVEEVALKDFAFDLADLAAPRPVQLALGDVQFSLKNLSLTDGAVMPLDLALNWAPAGRVHVVGAVTVKPALTAELKTEVAGLELLPLSPYLEQFVNARLTGGAFSTQHTVKLSLAGETPAMDLAGEIKVEKLGLVDSTQNGELAGFANLALSGLKVSTAPRLAASVAEINVAGPYARIAVNGDGTLNLAALAKTSAAPATNGPKGTSAGGTPTATVPLIEVGRVVMAGGDFSFADRSVEPHARMALTQFGGTIGGVSSANPARADVDLKGVVDGTGPVAITGKLDPLGAKKFVELKVDFKNVDLVPLSPYAGKFAGYELARGKLVVDTKVLLDDRKIDATNVVTLNQFTFGAATNSREATALPVRLGVALLKDLDGKIVIDLPVQGSLDDPNFRFGKVVLNVVVNLLTKAAVSPFKLLGSMFGGGGDELAFQEFAPGASELQAAELPKLATMIKALGNRPGLSLALEGSFDAAADGYEVKRQKLAETVRRQIWEARRAATPNIPPPAQLEITPTEHAAMVKKLFDEKFPPGTQFGTPLPAAPAVANPPPAPRPGLFKRVLNVVTLTERRQQRATEKEKARVAAEHTRAQAAAAAAGLPLAEMTGRLAEAIVVTDNDLRALATARAQRVRDYLVETGKIEADRLFLAQSQDAAKQSKGPRVFLSLQ